ncbi:hypothetical protein D3273_13305 [Lichenibacterium minor]|uniref:Porin n=1 Tax=Lichenibacterium minor TaxID=2316528 RepID=A0A4Q2U6V3_9HYPH|nr:hypothetical protein [Lichenibacterium minor]RYC31608.1 hypothetical protein D3273_13305 [Lichenibacterium minor]
MSRALVPLIAAAAFAVVAGPAGAATAFNSQRGALEHNKNICEATAYFPAGGCLSAYIAGDGRDLFDQEPAPYRPGHRLAYPDGFVPPPAR